MPLQIKIEGIYTKNKHPLGAFENFHKALKIWMQGSVNQTITHDFLLTVQGWSVAPSFRGVYKETRDSWSIWVKPTGRGVLRWGVTSHGRPYRSIYPRKASHLVFRPGYTPRTTSKPTFGGPGLRSGNYVKVSVVRRHRIAARNFEKWVAKRREKQFRREALEIARRYLK